MQFNPRWRSGGLWLLAGVPIVMTFLQAVFALSAAQPSDFPVLGTIVTALKSVPVLAAASTVFKQNPAIVPLLFMLVTIAWIAEGVTMFGIRRRKYANRAAGFLILFLVLFMLAYLPLLEASVPLVQIAGFLLVGVVAAGASWGAVYVHDWEPDLNEQTTEALATTRDRVREARRSFEDQLEQRADEDTRDRLRDIAPEGVEGAEERIEAFRTECNRMETRADEIASDTGNSAQERVWAAELLAEEAADLSPDTRVQAVVDTLTSQLPDAIRREFDDIHLVSRYGEAYQVRNHTDSNTVRLPSIETHAQIGGEPHDLGERLVEAIDEYPLPAVASAVADARDHLEALSSIVERHEEQSDERVEEARDRVAAVEDELDAVGGRVGNRLEELLLEGRYDTDPPPGPSAVDVESTISDGKACLHACDFTTAREHVEEAVETAGELISVAEFFRAVSETIADGGKSVPLPPGVDPGLALAMRTAVEREFDVTYEVADKRVWLEHPEEDSDLQAVPTANDREMTPDVEGKAGTTQRVDGTRREGADNERPDPATIVDEAVYVLNELERTAQDSVSAQTVEIQTDDLPEQCTEPGVLATVAEFGRRQRGVEAFDVPDDAPPGYLSLSVTDGENPTSVVDRIRDRYLNSYGTT